MPTRKKYRTVRNKQRTLRGGTGFGRQNDQPTVQQFNENVAKKVLGEGISRGVEFSPLHSTSALQSQPLQVQQSTLSPIQPVQPIDVDIYMNVNGDLYIPTSLNPLEGFEKKTIKVNKNADKYDIKIDDLKKLYVEYKKVIAPLASPANTVAVQRFENFEDVPDSNAPNVSASDDDFTHSVAANANSANTVAVQRFENFEDVPNSNIAANANNSNAADSNSNVEYDSNNPFDDYLKGRKGGKKIKRRTMRKRRR
jgi:hypothetical protein